MSNISCRVLLPGQWTSGTFDLRVSAFLTITGIDEITHGVPHVKTTDKVIEGRGAGQDPDRSVRPRQTLHIQIHSDDHSHTMGRVEVLFDSLFEEASNPHATIATLLDEVVRELGPRQQDLKAEGVTRVRVTGMLSPSIRTKTNWSRVCPSQSPRHR